MISGMSGIGWIEWLFICIPALVIMGVILAGVIYVINRSRSITQQNQNQVYWPGVSPNPPAPIADHYCSHCGAALQGGWTYCPQCGTPIQ
jgi:hypothetical protein